MQKMLRSLFSGAIALLMGISLVACGGGGGSGSTTPADPAITTQPASVTVYSTETATFNVVATGTGRLAYLWRKAGIPISGATSSSYTIPSTTLGDAGSYSVVVTGTKGSTASNNVTLTVQDAAPAITSQPSGQSVLAGQTATFSVQATGKPTLSFQWKKNNANISGARSSSYTTSATSMADNGSTYTVEISNGQGSISSNRAVLNVTATSSISTACTGVNCAAINATTYGGSGTGVWKYDNSSSANAVSLNIDIAGVSAGKQVTLAFSNGGINSASTAPQTGTQASTDLMQSAEIYATQPDKFSKLSQQQIHRHHAHERAHSGFLEHNSELVNRIKSGQKTTLFDPKKPSMPAAAPAIGNTRTWVDYSTSPSTSYPSTNQFNCSLPNGRNVVFWKSNTDSSLTPSILNTFTSSVCGNNKGFHQLIGLLGDAWGPQPYSNLISDSTMQDINIAFVNPPSNTGWAGYFWGRNNFISTPSYLTNSALVFFVNTNSIASDVNFYISTLIHEAKHMIGFYQKDILLDKTTDTWFEETGAMMAEDIVLYGLTGYNKIKDYRLPAYMQTGGNVSLNNWPSLSSNNYAMGGAFGAFLNRRYGTNLLTQSFTQCTGGSAKTSSYDCVNGLIVSNGGVGLADELARMGASLHSKLPALGNPSGYGYPAVTSNGFSLSAIDTSTMTLAAPNSVTTYSSMSQTYLNETIAAGKTRYIRNGVHVPAGTSFYLTIK
jgi:hypothetical protein